MLYQNVRTERQMRVTTGLSLEVFSKWLDLGYMGLEKDCQPAQVFISLKNTKISNESVKELKKALNKRIA